MKSKGVAYLLWCAGFIGLCGLHRLYVGKIGTGLLWLFTLGLLGIGQLVDLFLLGGHVDVVNLKNGFGPDSVRAINNQNHQNVIVNVPGTRTPTGHQDTPAAMNSTEELERLAALFEKGHLTQEEFNARKAKLLAV